ncbi:hypothetical protein DRO66_00595 [Candidatus Bathyarchaeota archaeon]|nr:MAG: hypothetical protein DRO66_00595 [Candidatus Bathyarchaeota archaeon]
MFNSREMYEYCAQKIVEARNYVLHTFKGDCVSDALSHWAREIFRADLAFRLQAHGVSVSHIDRDNIDIALEMSSSTVSGAFLLDAGGKGSSVLDWKIGAVTCSEWRVDV